jgi:hypothetical protein
MWLRLLPRYVLLGYSICDSRRLSPFVICYPRRLYLLLRALFAPRRVRCFAFNWMLCALTMAEIKPGNRFSISWQREVLCISTPRRSPRTRPASRSALKCWESVDFGIGFSLTLRKFEQFWGHSDATISA